MADDRNQEPANANEAGDRESQLRSGSNRDTQSGGGNQRETDGGSASDRANDKLRKESDEYRQSHQNEVQPDIDGEDREDETERPNTARGSRGSNDLITGAAGSSSD